MFVLPDLRFVFGLDFAFDLDFVFDAVPAFILVLFFAVINAPLRIGPGDCKATPGERGAFGAIGPPASKAQGCRTAGLQR